MADRIDACRYLLTYPSIGMSKVPCNHCSTLISDYYKLLEHFIVCDVSPLTLNGLSIFCSSYSQYHAMYSVIRPAGPYVPGLDLDDQGNLVGLLFSNNISGQNTTSVPTPTATFTLSGPAVVPAGTKLYMTYPENWGDPVLNTKTTAPSSHFPHTCQKCQSPAYIGLNKIECSNVNCNAR